MRVLSATALLAIALAGISPVSADDTPNATIVGFAFVDSSVTSQGSRAQLSSATKIYPPGSRVTGTEGCPTNRYHTDGMPILVFDYQGRPTSGSVTIVEHPARGGEFSRAPYYLDIDPGRRLQNLGPIFDNGSYDVRLDYHYAEGATKETSATLILDRTCHF
ncbi:MAG TPA: hypothetical protein VMA09_08340 [Candidatus Binataceae bacterium]|nr:hypothetical protein [Candidatus Binataceae bacterium]